jgi:glycosyltransferase involved in cell wall biosynthesis
MKILVVNWQDISNPHAGGAEVHLHEVFSRMGEAGHAVTLLCSAYPGAPSEERMGSVEVIRTGGRYLFDFQARAALRSRLPLSRFDVVVDDMNKIPFFLPLVAPIPVCCVTHHLFGRSIFHEANPLLASYVYAMETAAVRLYARRRVPFVVGSESTRDELVARGCAPESVHIVHYGVDHDRHRVTGMARSTAPLIGYFGRLKRYKSVDHLLEAFPRIQQAIPEIGLVIVGDGDDRMRLERIASALGIADAVEFAGRVSDQRKVELLQKVWCKVTTSAKEGWGLTVLEANACGTPVVASNVPGLRDAVRDGVTGLLFPYGDRVALADAVIRLVRNEELRQRLALEALSWARSFTWDRAAEETTAILERVAARMPVSSS